MSENKTRNCSRKCGNNCLSRSPNKRSTLYTQNSKNKIQRSPIRNKNGKTIALEIPLNSDVGQKHISTQTTVTEPDSTSISFIQKNAHNSKKHVDFNARCSDSNKFTWLDILRERNKDSSTNKFERKKQVVLDNNHCQCQNICEKTNVNYISQQIYLLNKFVNTLYEKLSETNNGEILYLISNIRGLLTTIPQLENASDPIHSVPFLNANGLPKVDHELHSVNSCLNSQCNTNTIINKQHENGNKHYKNRSFENWNQAENCEENRHTEDLNEIKNSITSISIKTAEYGKSLVDFQKLMLHLYNENKAVDKIKTERLDLELKLAASIYENKYLKKELKMLHEENSRVANELKIKNEEITNWKNQILKIRHMVSVKSNKRANLANKSDLSVLSIPIEEYSECPISSSPLDGSFCNEHVSQENVAQTCLVRSVGSDSGIQSNTPGNDGKKTEEDSKNLPFKSSFHHILLELKEKLQIKDTDLQLYMSAITDAEASICLSEATYRHSIPSLNTLQQ